MSKRNEAKAALDDEVFEVIAPVLRVLGHPDRLRIVHLLTRRNVTVAELAETLRLAPNTASQHLNNMLAHGIVRKSRRGRAVYYEVVHPAAKSLLLCMRRNVGQL